MYVRYPSSCLFNQLQIEFCNSCMSLLVWRRRRRQFFLCWPASSEFVPSPTSLNQLSASDDGRRVREVADGDGCWWKRKKATRSTMERRRRIGIMEAASDFTQKGVIHWLCRNLGDGSRMTDQLRRRKRTING